jgi:DNA adenine methylase
VSRYRTPLRYPGGKQRISPFVRELIATNSLNDGHYVEPYAGGAGIAMELLLDGVVSHVHLNDISIPLYAFWNSVLSRPDDLCERVACASLTVEEWRKRRSVVQSPQGHDELDVGFSTLYLNRCNRSGVLSGGLIGGIAQASEWNMDARFPRTELIRRIQAIASRRDAITVYNHDAKLFMQTCIETLPTNTLVYCDPPYFNVRSRLYMNRYKMSDHIDISRIIQGCLKRKWIVSYDSTPEIQQLYRERRLFSYLLQYNAAQVYRGSEILIFSDDIVMPSRSALQYINSAIQSFHATN